MMTKPLSGQKISKTPDMALNASLHRRGDPQTFVNAHNPPGVLEEMKIRLPKNESGNRRAKLWPTLSADTGIPHLDRQINDTNHNNGSLGRQRRFRASLRASFRKTASTQAESLAGCTGVNPVTNWRPFLPRPPPSHQRTNRTLPPGVGNSQTFRVRLTIARLPNLLSG